MTNSNSSTPKKAGKGPDDARAMAGENGIVHGDCASQKHTGSPVVYTLKQTDRQTDRHTHTHVYI